jgi:hypothetical protein
MEEKTDIQGVELVRRIRDQQAEFLAGKSNEAIIEFFRRAGEAAKLWARPPKEPDGAANNRVQQDRPPATAR